VLAARALAPAIDYSHSPKRAATPQLSKLPQSAYIYRREPLPLQNENFRYDEKDHVWHTTVFPSIKPATRRDAQLLQSWLRSSIANIRDINPSNDLTTTANEAEIYETCIEEVARQVFVECPERGRLLLRVIKGYSMVFQIALEELRASEERLRQQKGECMTAFW